MADGRDLQLLLGSIGRQVGGTLQQQQAQKFASQQRLLGDLARMSIAQQFRSAPAGPAPLHPAVEELRRAQTEAAKAQAALTRRKAEQVSA